MSSILQEIEARIANVRHEAKQQNVGVVSEIGDGVAKIEGLDDLMMNEMIDLGHGVTGIAMNLEETSVGAILMGDYTKVSEGQEAKGTGRLLQVPVGKGMLGRVVNALGQPIDGKGDIKNDAFYPVEKIAPGIITRRSVNQPVQTGSIPIDAMIPIGRGQRELIIGDRQTGKTSLAIDTILNQKPLYDAGNPVYCIYVAIGKKGSTVSDIAEKLSKLGAMPYTVIVSATASDPAALQFYAAFAGAAIGEYFRDTGRSALVIFDDLSKQAVSYREVSLLLRRPPGREAYPGDIFYLHSRLLERAAKIINNDVIAAEMNDVPESLKGLVKGGGSLTALPIIETQAGDVSAYIPTNVISITDGQIYLESKLFNAGIRPAINVGISVSRVGGNAQIKSMKKVAGTLKIDQAQYRELEAFSRFGSSIDAQTAEVLDKGRKNVELLKQDRNSALHVSQQVALLYCGTKGLLRSIPIDQVRLFVRHFLLLLEEEQPSLMEEMAAGHFDDRIAAILEETAHKVTASLTR